MLKRSLLAACVALNLVGCGSDVVQSGDHTVGAPSRAPVASASHATGSAPATTSSGAASAALATASVTSCSPGDGIVFTAAVRLTNSTDQPRSYVVDVAVSDPAGEVVGRPQGTIENVAAGKTVTVDAVARATGPLKAGNLSCRVTEVTAG